MIAGINIHCCQGYGPGTCKGIGSCDADVLSLG